LNCFRVEQYEERNDRNKKEVYCNFIREGKRWNIAKEKMSKKAEGRSAKSVTGRQTDKLKEQCCSVLSGFNPHSVATQNNH
jgi:hypothetical protein